MADVTTGREGGPVDGVPPNPILISPISVVVLTFMEEINIEHCLRSVAGWAADIHVVDSGSTDRTIEIARKFAHQIHVHPYIDHSTQIQYVLTEVPLKYEWLLILDADHVVSHELKHSIDSVLETDSYSAVDLFYFPQMYEFQGQPIRSLRKWGRLLRHQNVVVEGGELVDFRFRPSGAVGYLRGQVTERNLKEYDLDFWIDKHQKFASRMAIEECLRRTGEIRWTIRPRLFGHPDERLVWLKNRWYSLPLFLRPFLFFSYRYVWRLGFLEGRTGFVFHFMQAFWFRMIVDIKLFALERRIAAGDLGVAELLKTYAHDSGARPDRGSTC